MAEHIEGESTWLEACDQGTCKNSEMRGSITAQ